MIFEWVGEHLLRLFHFMGSLTNISFRCIVSLLSFRMHFKNWIQEVVKLGYDSLPVVLITALAVGMVFAVQVAREFAKYGAIKVIGGTVGIALWRELAPVLTAVVIAGRVGSSITAELGSMKVTEQVDALKAMGFSRTNFLVAPRFWSMVFALPLLVVLADIVSLLGAYVVATYNGVNSVAFIESVQTMLHPYDILGGLLKSVIFGAMLAGVACHKGLETSGGAAGVGKATTESVVISLILIFVSNYFLSNFLF